MPLVFWKERTEEMEIDIIGLLNAFSYALDCVEAELVHVTTRHGKRVAYISVCMAENMGITGDELTDLAACALLHDNALLQYIQEEFRKGAEEQTDKSMTPKQVAMHCVYGEKNLKNYPFHTDVTNVILYHHENADGSGPFRKTWEETPLFARMIHLADKVDTFCKTDTLTEEIWEKTKNYILKYRGRKFDEECTEYFLQSFGKERFFRLASEELEEYLWKDVPHRKEYYSYEALRKLADLFAGIIDYKSEFTGRHSLGVAAKAAEITEYMGYDRETVEKMYFAGALHDIGKIIVGNDILEKPARLTEEEFAHMKDHAACTYMLLSGIEGMEEIRDWAAFHHEKLDGSGYPFGKTAEELSEPERIMACADIYQALVEDRPYKKGMDHEKACSIMNDMAERNWIDPNIVHCIQKMYQK